MATRYIEAGTTAELAVKLPKLPGVAAIGYDTDLGTITTVDPSDGSTNQVPVGLGATAAEIDAVADLSANLAVIKTKVIPIAIVAATTETDTGVNLPAKALVLDVSLDVQTAEATGGTKTLDVGTLSSESGGDANGFLVGISAAGTGLIVPSLAAAGVTLGALLIETVTDSNSDTLSARKPYATTLHTAKSITYTLGSNDWVEFVGNIVITYVEVA
jgi:hypothetical protein